MEDLYVLYEAGEKRKRAAKGWKRLYSMYISEDIFTCEYKKIETEEELDKYKHLEKAIAFHKLQIKTKDQLIKILNKLKKECAEYNFRSYFKGSYFKEEK